MKTTGRTWHRLQAQEWYMYFRQHSNLLYFAPEHSLLISVVEFARANPLVQLVSAI